MPPPTKKARNQLIHKEYNWLIRKVWPLPLIFQFHDESFHIKYKRSRLGLQDYIFLAFMAAPVIISTIEQQYAIALLFLCAYGAVLLIMHKYNQRTLFYQISFVHDTKILITNYEKMTNNIEFLSISHFEFTISPERIWLNNPLEFNRIKLLMIMKDESRKEILNFISKSSTHLLTKSMTHLVNFLHVIIRY